MSFSYEVKQELCRVPPECPDCQKAQAYGMLLFSHAFRGKSIFLQTEHRQVMNTYVELLTALTAPIISIETTNFHLREEARIHTVSVENEDERAALYRLFEVDPAKPLHIDPQWMPRGCCAVSFIRGAYLVCGSVSNPDKEYHLEFAVDDPTLATELHTYLSENGITCKQTTRKNANLLYQKGSEAIEDTLTLLGAAKQALELMEVKILKDVRNRTNRKINCETANITKTVNAAYQQREDILYIQQTVGLSSLKEELRQLAELRLEYPEYSLRELQELLQPPVSRSCVNHRLKKLSEIANELRKSHKE